MIKTIENFLSTDEVSQLVEYFKTKSYANVTTINFNGQQVTKSKHKNSEYEQSNSLVYQILHNKIQSTMGDHTMTHGSLLESHFPYPLHVDTYETFQEKNFYNLNNQNSNISLLISLNEHPQFKTVFFDLKTPVLKIPADLPMTNTPLFPDYPDLNFDHCDDHAKEFLKSLKITNVYNWKTGNAVYWPRNQVHCSSNFYGLGLTKNALVLFF